MCELAAAHCAPRCTVQPHTFHAGVLKSAMDDSGSTTSPTISSCARASSATSKSDSSEPAVERPSNGSQHLHAGAGKRRQELAEDQSAHLRRAPRKETGTSPQLPPRGGNAGCFAQHRMESRKQRVCLRRDKAGEATNNKAQRLTQVAHLANVVTVSAGPEEVHAPASVRVHAQTRRLRGCAQH